MAEHDNFFKWAMRLPEHAAGEFLAILPSELLEALDLSSLTLLQSDIVSQQLNERFSDALFRANFRGTAGYLWLLLEHQSESDRFMVLRVLEYLVRSWIELLRREPARKTLPPFACVVVHHGESGWRHPTRLHDLVEGLSELPALRRFVPNFEILVDDLVEQTDDALKARPLGTLPRVALWVLRDARTIQRFFAHLKAWTDDLARLAVEAPEDAETVMRYIIKTAGDESFERLRSELSRAAPTLEATLITFEEQILQRGRAQGVAEGRAQGVAEGKAQGVVAGRAEGMAQALLAVLSARGLTVGESERALICACDDIAQLERWLQRVTRVSSVAELLAS
ncbi:MAG: Rpn family recombination-promoting nuclease/putative transposase [Myxococcota bacterium]